MKRNNKALYEQIMRNIAKQVKKALNESVEESNKVIPFDCLTVEDFDSEAHNTYEDFWCNCKIDLCEVIKRHKDDFNWIENLDGYLNWLQGQPDNLQDFRVTYQYNEGTMFYYEIPEVPEDLIDEFGIGDDYEQFFDESLYDALLYAGSDYIPEF